MGWIFGGLFGAFVQVGSPDRTTRVWAL